MLIVSEGELIVIAKLRFALSAALSVTVAVKVKAPAVVGVPVIDPLESRDSPAGGEPDHRYGGVPPDADKFCE